MPSTEPVDMIFNVDLIVVIPIYHHC